MFEKSCQCQVHRTWYRLHSSSPEAEVSTYSTEFDGSQDFSNTLSNATSRGASRCDDEWLQWTLVWCCRHSGLLLLFVNVVRCARLRTTMRRMRCPVRDIYRVFWVVPRNWRRLEAFSFDGIRTCFLRQRIDRGAAQENMRPRVLTTSNRYSVKWNIAEYF